VVAVDPALGRIWFPPGAIPAAQPILVTYGYAFSGPYGAGFFSRTVPGQATLKVTRDPATLQPNLTMTGAINTALGGGLSAIVEYADNVTDSSATNLITISGGENVTVRAADRRRPTFLRSITVSASVPSGQSGTLVLDGFLLGAGVIVTGSGTLELVIRNCTILPDKNDNDAIAWSGASGTLTLEHSICTAVVLPTLDVDASISDSIVDAGTGTALTAGSVSLVRCTVFGSATVREVGLISNSIITGTVTSARTQAGCVRYSWLPRGSTVPQRYRCQPDGAAQAAIEAAAIANPALTSAQLQAIGDLAAAQIVPQFNDVDEGDPAYAQLSIWCPPQISAGADDGGEMGVFHDLFSEIREANLLYRLDENLRISLDAGVLHAS
jgi:hypothetical protein